MKIKIKNLFILLFAFYFLLFTFPPPTHAYLDPGSGSFIIQTVFALLFASLLTLKIFFRNIKDFFKSFFSDKKVKKDEEKD